MPLISITGTPGTGKTAVSEELRKRGYNVLDVNKYLRDNDLLKEKDVDRDSFNVDIDGLNYSLECYREDGSLLFLDSHLSHCIDCSTIIVLRCHPDVLAKRLAARGYNDAKVRENVQAEILDVILCEATESDIPVFEFDCTDSTVSEVVDGIEHIINGDVDDHKPGNINWTEEIEKWF